MKPTSFDVAVVGGGPGGSATALSLRSHSPSLSVVLIEASHYEAVRIGESLPPPAKPILDHLGVWDAFQRQSPCEVHGTAAAWGSAALLDNDFIFMPANVGWHLDRAAFDAMLADEAGRLGGSLLFDTRVRDVKSVGDGWRLNLSDGNSIDARFVVDATGGNAALARRCGARFVETDTLVGIAGFFENGDDDARTLVEAFEDGWWYTAGLPDGRRIIACMTDADIARRKGLHEAKEWRRKLAEMSVIGAMTATAGRGKLSGPLVIRSCSSRRLEPAAGKNWLAAGDAASRFDPLSAQGIVKALRSGVFAGYAIGDQLTRNDDSGLERYRRFVFEEFKNYTEVRVKYYREETRWPTSEFWRRRHALVERAEAVSI
jgi:2-polyprenyl-6-methoxyphenol hydroxylase-like FAD-dependent oxidoreductase